MDYIQSSLNYTGGKYKLLPQILPNFPEDIHTFVDLFCGGCSVGLNVNAEHVILNDIEPHLISLLKAIRFVNSRCGEEIDSIILRYRLSESTKHSYEYYGCDGSKGLASYNKEAFMKLRDDFNAMDIDTPYKWIMLYTLIVYGFNNQIRFNSKGEYNISVGKRDFNSRMRSKLESFVSRLNSVNPEICNKDFREFGISNLTKDDLIYADPPYLLSCATYNELGGWTEKDEKDLYVYLDGLNSRGVRFALSNVLRSKGGENSSLIEWSKKYKVIPLNFNYNNSSYHLKDKDSLNEEVLIVNYD